MSSVITAGVALIATRALAQVIIPAALSRINIPKEANWLSQTKFDKREPTLSNTYRFNANNVQGNGSTVSSNNNVVSDNNTINSNKMSANKNSFLSAKTAPISRRTEDQTPVVNPTKPKMGPQSGG